MQIRWVPLFVAGVVFAGALGSATASASGDPQAGEAQALVCAACHGQDGATGIDPSYPNLAGQNEKYLYNQLTMIQNGDRAILLMTGQLIGKSDQDLQNLAAYYASLPGKLGQASGDDASVQLAQAIYRGGILKKGVAACSACHSPNGNGNSAAGFPVLTGQPKVYTIAQLTAYREGERRSDESFGGMMRGVTGTLTDGEIAALADYLQGLH
jgi:cytochrome c553